jgi:hypothetical protein
MKTLNIALVAASLLAAATPALAGDGDSASYKDQMTNLWISTGDAAYARQAGLTDREINAVKQLPRESASFSSND